MATAAIQITDWDNPQLPLLLRIFNFLFEFPMRWLIKLDVDSLLDTARQRTGLDNFGDDSFLEPLGVLVGSLENEAPLSAFGRIISRESIVKALMGRLYLEELYLLHPEIQEEKIGRPIIVAGLPRTGTTHLFNLLSRDSSLSWMPYWETLDPFPPQNEKSPEARIAGGEQALKIINWVMPQFSAFHEFHNDWPHEELQLLVMSFICLQWEASNLVPSYANWYEQADRAPAYAFLKRSLKALQYLRGRQGQRWILKCPEHLANLQHLANTFPDATFVQTHRDPLRIVASMSTMVAYSSRMQHKGSIGWELAQHWSYRTEYLLRKSVEDRHLLPSDQVVDVQFQDFMGDMKGTVWRIFEHAGHEYSDETDKAIDRFLIENPKGKHGFVDYRLAANDLGIDLGEGRRKSLSVYTERFKVKEDFLI